MPSSFLTAFSSPAESYASRSFFDAVRQHMSLAELVISELWNSGREPHATGVANQKHRAGAV